MNPYCVMEVLPNHTYRVERSGQTSVQSEQHLKLYHASPDVVGQASPLPKPNRQPNYWGRTTQPREVEIFIQMRPEQEQFFLLLSIILKLLKLVYYIYKQKLL